MITVLASGGRFLAKGRDVGPISFPQEAILPLLVICMIGAVVALLIRDHYRNKPHKEVQPEKPKRKPLMDYKIKVKL